MVPKRFIVSTFLIMFLLTLLSINVFAVNNWNSINNGNLGNTQDPTFSADLPNTTTSIQSLNYQSVSAGGIYAPSILDVNYDGINELVTHSGSSVLIYNGDNNQLNLEATISLTGTIKNVQAIELPSSSSTDKKIRVIAVATASKIYILNYKNNVDTIYQVGVIPAGEVLTSNIVCGVDNRFALPIGFCGYFTNTTKFHWFAHDDFLTSELAIASPTIYTDLYTGLTINSNTNINYLLASDVDNDGTDEFSFHDNSFLYSRYYNDNTTLYSNSNWNQYLKNTPIYKNYYFEQGYSSTTFYIKDIPTGNVVASASGLLAGALGGYTYVIGGFYNDNNTIKVLLVGQANGVFTLTTLDTNGATYTYSQIGYDIADVGTIATTSGNIIVNETNILIGKVLFNMYDVLSASFSTNTGINYVLADLSGDYKSEVIEYKTGLIGVGFPLNISVLTPLSISNSVNGGFFNYYSPVCVGTTIEFKARECLELPYTNCNYFDTIDDAKERLATKCGYSGNAVTNGTFDFNSPSVSCNFAQVGTFPTTIFIQTESQPDDYGVRNAIPINISVIVGTSGIDCNLNYITIPTYNASPIITNVTGNAGGNVAFNDTPATLPDGYAGDSMWNSIWTGLLGQSSLTRLILGAVIIMLGMFGLLSVTQNATFLIIGFACMLLIVFAMQLIPLWVPALLVVLFLAMWGLNKALGNNGNDGTP